LKRKLAIAFVATILLLVGGLVALLRTDWAGRRICQLAEQKVESATGLPLSLSSCQIDPWRLRVSAEQVRLGSRDAPIFTADSVSARLAPVQAFGRRLQIRELAAVKPRLVLALPPRRTEAKGLCPPPLLEQFELQHLRVDGGSLDLTLPTGARVILDRFDVQSAPASRPSLRSLASAVRRSRVILELGPARVDTGGRLLHLDQARSDVEVALDLSRLQLHQLDLAGEGLRLSAHGEVTNLCDPTLDLDLSAQTELPALFALLRSAVPSQGSLSIEGHLSGKPSSLAAKGRVRLAGAQVMQYVPGDLQAALSFAGSTLSIDRLEVPFRSGGSVLVKGKVELHREPVLNAEVETRQIEFAELLERLGLTGSYVMMRLSSQSRLSGTVWPFHLTGEAGVDIQDFRVLDHSWRGYRAGEPAVLDFRRARLDAGVRVGLEGIGVEKGRLRMGEETLGVDGQLFFTDARGFHLAVDGSVDLDELRHVASVPWAGRMSLTGSIRAEPYGDPIILARARARDFRFLQLDLGDFAAAVAYQDLQLRIDEGQGTKGETRYTAQAAVDLGRTPAVLGASRFSAQGRLRDLFDATLRWLPASRRLRDLLDATVSMEGKVAGPVTALNGEFDASMGRGTLLARGFDSGRARWRVVAGKRAVFDRLELQLGEGTARASGAFELNADVDWSGQMTFDRVPLAGLSLPGGDWQGVIGGRAGVSGSLAHPVIQVSAAGEGVTFHGVPVGSLQVNGGLSGDRLELDGTADGLELHGGARLSGELPFQISADLDLADVTRLFPGGPPAGLHAEVKGEAHAEGRLGELENTRARLKLSRLRGGYGDFRVDNREPVVLSLDRGRVELESFTLLGVNTEFTLSGARSAKGELDFGVGGSLDLRLLAGLVPSVSSPHGQLTLDARVGGTSAEPLLVGAGRVKDAGFQIRDLPIVFARMSGDLAFSQNRVLFDELAAVINGGRTSLHGEVELARFSPAKLRVEAELDTVPMTIPSYIPSWVSGQLTVLGSPEALTLAGKLHVLRASYTEKVDLEKSILELKRRRAAPRPYDKAGEWLRFDVELLVDGDARVDNDLVKGNVKGDVTLTGSLAAMGMVGTLAMTPGSRATLRGNEFGLSHVVVDFVDRHRILAKFDVHGEAQVRDYQVFLHYYGTLEDPQLQLTSSPALTQQDILTLLSLGITTRDTAATSGVGGIATAAAAQALFSASGLDEQMRRFLPREGPFKDISMRVTSAYSEGSGQVEPRAEFEGKIADRLRLRYQAPISGARGQRAQAELKLGEHSSLQYQWDNDNPDVVTGGDHGLDLKFRWEWND
jgi:translocation and assembly module TamB